MPPRSNRPRSGSLSSILTIAFARPSPACCASTGSARWSALPADQMTRLPSPSPCDPTSSSLILAPQRWKVAGRSSTACARPCQGCASSFSTGPTHRAVSLLEPRTVTSRRPFARTSSSTRSSPRPERPSPRQLEDPTLLDSIAGPVNRRIAVRPAPGGGVVEESTRIRVLIDDAHAVVRMGVRVSSDLQDAIECVAEAADGSEGVAMARRLEPDVILMDLLMPNMDGITAIGRIKAERPETEIVTMTSFIEEDKVTAALEAGASGYVLKDAEAEEVATAVRAAFAGEVHLDPAVARLLAQRMRAKKSGEGEPVEPLTDREKDGIRLLGRGMSNKES